MSVHGVVPNPYQLMLLKAFKRFFESIPYSTDLMKPRRNTDPDQETLWAKKARNSLAPRLNTSSVNQRVTHRKQFLNSSVHIFDLKLDCRLRNRNMIRPFRSTET